VSGALLFLVGVLPSSAVTNFSPQSAGEDDVVQVRISDRASVASLRSLGARLVDDYGAFEILEVNRAAAAGLANQPGVEIEAGAYRIELNVGAIDTLDATVRTSRAPARVFTGKRLQLVQFVGPVKPEWYEALEKTGVRIVTYIPHNAYLIYGDAKSLDEVGALSASQWPLRWQGEYVGDDKIQPRARAVDRKGNVRALDTDLFAVQMVDDPTANASTLALIDGLKRAPVLRDNAIAGYRNLIVRLDPASLSNLADQPDVVSINLYVMPKKLDERQNQISAGNLTGDSPSGPGYLAWLTSKGFTQSQFTNSGIVVDVTDSGIDNGNTTVGHFGLYTSGNTGLADRVVYNRLEGTPNSGSTLAGCDGHGNINAHIIGGYNDLSGSTHTDSAGYRYGLGICPYVKVGSSVIFDSNEFTSPDYEDLISRAYRDGARISSDSWGADTFGGYDVDAQAYDALVRDAQPTGAAVSSNGNQQMTIVFAAGNSGPSGQTVGSPGTAKNIITAGASENVHSHSSANGGEDASGNDGCETTDADADSANDMAFFSSRGPCSDSRKKPDLVAPGTHITGGVAQQLPPPSPTGTGNDLACFDATGVCALPSGKFFPTGQQFYSTSSGTSHSTPAIAGGAALVLQYFINQAWGNASPAMVKSYLMNSARYLDGDGASDSLYSNNQGMGGMNLGTAFDGVARVLRDQAGADTFTASGQTRTFTGTISDSGKPFRVTLGWTDAPGATSGSAYKNNLDLTVTVGGNSYKGNVFSGANSTTGGSADTRNNVESVFLPAGVSGAYVVTITATSINSDGVPNEAPSLDQDFALVIYNGVESIAPVVASEGSTLIGENCGSGNGKVDPDEMVTVRLALRNLGTADTTNVVATLQATGGVSSPSSPQNYGSLLAGGAAVTNTFTFTATGTCGGTVTATLQIQDGAADLGTVSFLYTLGDSIAASQTNSMLTSISIPAVGPASPYPSAIAVSGMAGTVSKVAVTLNGLSHTWPADVDVVLVGPAGQNVLLMSGVGGGTAINNVNLTFDDAASSTVPTPISSGTYQPTDGGVGADLDPPAPSAPYGSALSVFNGTDPNGTWSLYVLDGADEDSGSIGQGWRLAITAGEPFCCASNQPPILTPIGNKTAVITNAFQFTVTAKDPADGDPITLSASNTPAWATFLTVTNAGGVTNTFSANPDTTGVFNVTFYASDKDGVDTETISITVGDGSCVASNVLDEGFDSSTDVPANWVNGGSANDAVSGHYQSAPNCRAMGTADTLTSPAVDYPTQLVFFVDSSGGGNGQMATVEYSVDGGNFAQLAQFRVGTTGSNVILGLTGTPDLSASTAVRFRFNSTFNTWYLDDVQVEGGCPAGPPPQSPPILSPIGNRSVILSNTLQFAVLATATDDDAVTLSVSNEPAGTTFEAAGETGTFTWSNAAPLGVYTAVFYAADNDGADSESITITVTETPSGATNRLALYTFEDGGSVFTRAANDTALGITAGLMQSGDGGATNASGNPTWAIFDNGFTGTNYFEFTLTVSGGGVLSAKQIRFDDRRSNTGPSQWAVRSSADSYASDLAAGVSHLNFTTNEVTLAANSSAGTATFRIYGLNGQAGGTWRIDNVELLGEAGSEVSESDPLVVITTPDQTVANAVSSINLAGTANTNTVGELRWTNNLTGLSGTAPADTNWTINSVALNVGVNSITVSGSNSVGDVASDSVAITRQSAGGGGTTNLILFQGFEPGDGWTIASGAGRISTTLGAADTPPNQRIRTGSYSWQAANVTTNLDLIHAPIFGYTSRQVNVRFASISGNSANGADRSDLIKFYVALDGAAFSATPDVIVGGWTNSQWGYWATNQVVTTAGTLVSNASPQVFMSSNNFASAWVVLPDNATSVAFRVMANNNATSEIWCVDDIAVVGIQVSTGGDTDGDGIPDAVETAWCGTPTGCDPQGDTGDGDIYAYLEEYLLDYDPVVSNLDFIVESIVIQSPVTLEFEATNSRVYTVEFSTNLLEALPWQVLEGSLPGSNGVMSVIDTNEADQREYRIQVHLP